VDQTGHHCSRDHGIPQGASPIPKAFVRGRDQGSVLVDLVKQLEQSADFLAFQHRARNLVDDQASQLRSRFILFLLRESLSSVLSKWDRPFIVMKTTL
jgi:hypothetical protein